MRNMIELVLGVILGFFIGTLTGFCWVQTIANIHISELEALGADFEELRRRINRR